jgi:enoyl-CoA hydratase/carnithine racemase
MTKEWQHFRYVEEGAVATVTLDRPERLNALTFDTYADLRDLAFELSAERDRIKVLVLRGANGAFCSGGDVDDIIGKLIDEADTRTVYDFACMTGACVRNIRDLPQAVIAVLDGPAAGAGAVLAVAADFRILSERATFQFLFTRVGLSGGDMGICWLLPRVVGFGRATELLMIGEKIDAPTAYEYGLAHRVVSLDELDATVQTYVERLLRVSPWGVAMTKEMLNRAATMDYSSAIEMEAWTQTLLMTTADFAEFRRSFIEKRRPAFTGR